MTITMFFISGLVTIAIILCALLANAPGGYEDELGFHPDKIELPEPGKRSAFVETLIVVARLVFGLTIGVTIGGMLAWMICGK